MLFINSDFKPKLVKQYGYDIQVIECKSNFQNIHDVPQKAIDRMRARWQNIPTAIWNEWLGIGD